MLVDVDVGLAAVFAVTWFVLVIGWWLLASADVQMQIILYILVYSFFEYTS